MGMFDRMRERRLERKAAANPILEETWDWALREHRIFRGMGAQDELRLRELSTLFLAEKRFQPVREAEADEELKVSIAAQACLPLLGLDLSWYKGFSTIFVTPEPYIVTQRRTDEAGVVEEYEDEFAGEAFELGPVALSIPDVDASGWGDGYNTIIHEMAHKLDGLDGAYDGMPPLHQGMDPAAWKRILAEAYEDFRSKTEAQAARKPSGSRGDRGVQGPRGSRGDRGQSKKRSRIDPYAAESVDEFFAVACEYFWEKPSVLLREYPEFFSQLKLFFRRDPSEWGA